MTNMLFKNSSTVIGYFPIMWKFQTKEGGTDMRLSLTFIATNIDLRSLP